MLEHLTPAFVKRHFDDVCDGEVERFELPNLLAVNFLLHRALAAAARCRCCSTRRQKPTRNTCSPRWWKCRKTYCMRKLDTLINKNSSTFKVDLERMKQLVAELRQRVAVAREGGGAKYVQRHREQGKMPVRERIARLVDAGSAVPRTVPARGLRLYDDETPAPASSRASAACQGAMSSSSRTMRR